MVVPSLRSRQRAHRRHFDDVKQNCQPDAACSQDEAGHENAVGPFVDVASQRADVEQQRQRPHLRGYADQDWDHCEQVVKSPRNRVCRPMCDETQRKRQQYADDGDRAVPEYGLDRFFLGVVLVQLSLSAGLRSRRSGVNLKPRFLRTLDFATSGWRRHRDRSMSPPIDTGNEQN